MKAFEFKEIQPGNLFWVAAHSEEEAISHYIQVSKLSEDEFQYHYEVREPNDCEIPGRTVIVDGKSIFLSVLFENQKTPIILSGETNLVGL